MSKTRWKLWKLGHFQNSGAKKRELVYISSFHGFKLYFILIFTSFLFLPPEQRKQCNVSCFVNTNFFAIFQKVITSRVYKFSGCERNLLKKPFFLFVILQNSQLINCISSLSFSLSLSLSFFRFKVICNNIP